MDEWDVPLEETGEFDRQGDEGTSAADAGWKDELNLAEFPIAALTDRIPDGQTTMVFEDRMERRDSAPIVRRLTIMGTHKHGLPTSLDDEVLVGLIQLTKRRSNFTDPRVQFSRYELIELLGWPQSGQSYRRIEEALHRWVGVVLMYENAWWDNAAKSWVDEQFHVLDNVTLYDRERWRTSARSMRSGKGDRGGSKADKPPLPLSSFRWNEVIFQSFQSGNLKQLDLEFYLKLRLPTTKRMYRFLDKRFYRRVAAGLRPAVAGLRAHRVEPIVRADGVEAAAQAGAGGAGAARVPRAAGPGGAVLLRQAGLLEDHLHPRQPGDGRGAGPRRTAGAAARRADRGPQGAGRHRPDGAGAGRGAPARPGPHQDRGLRLAAQERGSAGRQEPGRLPGGLDPLGLPGPRRLSEPKRWPARQPARQGRSRGQGAAGAAPRPR